MKRAFIFTLAWLSLPGYVSAQETQRLHERFVPGTLYQVSCRVDISGQLSLPADKENPARNLAVKGTSAIDYDERILVEKQGKIDRTLRLYRRMDFERKVGEQVQQSALRPEVRMLVVMRHNQFEVPFCPSGPLTWNEIDLVRTDVFTPALAGLLPAGMVAPGERWQADNMAMQELTDLDRIEQGSLTCRFENIATLAKRRLARVTFHGEVKGIGEDGPSRHELDGYLFFDLQSSHLTYLYVRGTQHLVDKDGKSTGKIDGSFVLTREPLKESRELGEDALRGLALEPTDENTLLLYDNRDLGVRFLYPRNWRVAGVSGRQIALDEKRGSGLLITVEQLTKLPTGDLFRKETVQWLNEQKATIRRGDSVRLEQGAPNQIEQFAFDADLNKQRVVMDYRVLRQTYGGATLAGRLLPENLQTLQRDVARIARSVQVGR